MDVGGGAVGKRHVDHHVHVGKVNAPGTDVCANQNTHFTIRKRLCSGVHMLHKKRQKEENTDELPNTSCTRHVAATHLQRRRAILAVPLRRQHHAPPGIALQRLQHAVHQRAVELRSAKDHGPAGGRLLQQHLQAAELEPLDRFRERFRGGAFGAWWCLLLRG